MVSIRVKARQFITILYYVIYGKKQGKICPKSRREKRLFNSVVYGMIYAMAEKLKNIVEDIALDFLNNSLSLRYDICRCPQCRNDMLAFMLSNLPARYVTTEKGELATIIEQAKFEHQAAVAKASLAAIEKISKNPRHKLKEDKEQVFQMLLNKIYEDRGVDFRQYCPGVIKRKLAVRIRNHNLESYSDYLRFLISRPEEYDKLLEELCINVTEFFRDPPVWKAVKKLFEDLIKKKKARKENIIRIWSAGCSSGEEAYSIAIALTEILKFESQKFRVELYATDIDRKCLDAAKKASYQKASLKNVDDKLLRIYFTLLDNGSYLVKDEISTMVKLQYLNLINDEPVKDTDVVFCRNVFIYFNRNLQEQLLMKFYQSLRVGGYLVKGQSETIFNEAGSIFKDIDSSARIYQKMELV